ncbi:hypothetical protein A0J61_02142 [Choanephora cucurbitarum]|uniref:Uncharacterized protein n=1 Tax=Choanephora cucurbitarum TaxID=101091 RepID=A0A1C7NL11_9FUNG|nr:hypothetical protein A0J61_02142 [Choanephora cucurbitarum]
MLPVKLQFYCGRLYSNPNYSISSPDLGNDFDLGNDCKTRLPYHNAATHQHVSDLTAPIQRLRKELRRELPQGLSLELNVQEATMDEQNAKSTRQAEVPNDHGN